MKLVLFLLCFTIADPILKWSEKKLTPKDFKRVTMTDGKAGTASTGILLTVSDRIYAEAIFDKSQSMLEAGLTDQQLSKILQHEQLHFDITEYITRQLNKNLKGLNSEQAGDLYEKYLIKLDSMQTLYDRETNHSNDSVAQYNWTIYLIKLLKQK